VYTVIDAIRKNVAGHLRAKVRTYNTYVTQQCGHFMHSMELTLAQRHGGQKLTKKKKDHNQTIRIMYAYRVKQYAINFYALFLDTKQEIPNAYISKLCGL